ncbi:MAG: hypothetical protein LBH44_07960 [Treponema sp.]|jgi:hypothetical protein|nr:hypothetical protein [Treponema sp.]
MKKTSLIIAVVLLAALIFASCGGTPSSNSSSSTTTASAKAEPAAPKERKVPGAFPQFVKDAIKNSPEDALIGIGSAKMATLAMSRTMSSTRARAEISRQMNTMIQDMVRDYTAASEIDPSAALSFQENITVALSKAELVGAKVVDQDVDEQGNVWTVVMLGKTNTVEIINQQQAAAKLAIPAMASFNAEDRMNDAFAKAYNQEVGVGSN